MMNKKELTAFAKNIIRSQKGLQNPQLMHPRREWIIGILVATFIFGASIAWSSVKYFEYKSSDTLTSTEPASPVAVYRQNLVQEALEVLVKKEQQLSVLLGVPLESLPEEEMVEVDSETVTENTDSTSTSTINTTAASSTEVEIDDGSSQELEPEDTEFETPENNVPARDQVQPAPSL